MQLFLLTVGILTLALAGIAIKMFVKKGGEFKKQCATIEFESGEKIGCVCDSERHEDCKYYDVHHGRKVVSTPLNDR
ncbi:MAG: hypothetical protein FWE63_03580 [Bacteroidales bacterium]|nr:hypothetical protein [Bacteroidales bacterium]